MSVPVSISARTASTSAAIVSASAVGGLNYINTGGALNVRGFAGRVHGQLFGFVNAGANNVALLHMDGTLPDQSAKVFCPGRGLAAADAWAVGGLVVE